MVMVLMLVVTGGGISLNYLVDVVVTGRGTGHDDALVEWSVNRK